jgi:hypothetical protein
METNRPRRPLIVVRSRCRDHHGEWQTEWTETTRSWRKAWSIVGQTDTPRNECRKFQVVGGDWFLDLGGVEEHADRVNAHAALMAL